MDGLNGVNGVDGLDGLDWIGLDGWIHSYSVGILLCTQIHTHITYTQT